jgi:hypothetical protein
MSGEGSWAFPAVGPVLASAFVASMPDPAMFKSRQNLTLLGNGYRGQQTVLSGQRIILQSTGTGGLCFGSSFPHRIDSAG